MTTNSAQATQPKSKKDIELRPDLAFISEFVTNNSRVLDLGCGNGLLLEWLRKNRNCEVFGVDIKADEVIETISRQIPVLRCDLDEGLPMFDDKSFDVVILSLALMQVKNPGQLIEEMLRVGKKIIVSYPNFGYWKIRFYLLQKGRMPMGSTVPYTWYETPNIHHTTLYDFRDFLANFNAKIEREAFLKKNSNGELKSISFRPNLRAETVIVVASK